MSEFINICANTAGQIELCLLKGALPQELLDVLCLVNFQERFFFLWEKKEVDALAQKVLLGFLSLWRTIAFRPGFGVKLGYFQLNHSQTPVIYWRDNSVPFPVYSSFCFVKLITFWDLVISHHSSKYYFRNEMLHIPAFHFLWKELSLAYFSNAIIVRDFYTTLSTMDR